MDTINLGKGHPSARLLPVELLQSGISLLGHKGSRQAMQYGGQPGASSFAESMSLFLAERAGYAVDRKEILPTAGNSMTLSMICQLFAQPGDTVVCSDPTYFHAMSVLRTAGMKLVTVGVDKRGLDVQQLESELQGGLRPKLVYCIPAFHNPCGVNLAPERAERLLELAVDFDFLVVADEPYNLLHFGPQAPPSLMRYDRDRARVLALGSFSKLLAPGLRCGWLQAAPDLLKRFGEHGALRSGGYLNPWLAAVIDRLLRQGQLGPHIDTLRNTYAERMHTLSQALRALAKPVPFVEPQGGYFLWLPIPAATFQAVGVQVIAGSRCSPAGHFSGCSRLSISASESHDLAEAIARLPVRCHV